MGITVKHSSADIGSFVTDISLPEITDGEFQQIRDLVHRRSVVAVRGQTISQADQVRFASRFGELRKVFNKELHLAEHPELFFVSNVLKDGKPIGSTDAGIHWHTDGAFLTNPHDVSMLYAEEVPHHEGRPLGDTNFAGMGAAYDALPESTKRRLDGLRGVHSLYHRYGVQTKDATENAIKLSREYPPVSHPLVVRNPVTGRKSLYLSEGYTTHIEGLPKSESDALVNELCEHVVDPRFRYCHSWAVGDLLIWDNRATLHRATFDYALPQRRVMRRATVAGGPLC